MADRVLVRAEPDDLRLHAQVCDHICRRTLALEYLPASASGDAREKAQTLRDILQAARGLRRPLARMTLKHSDLTVEKADVLVLLYEHHLRHEAGHVASGFMPLAKLRLSLVHSLSNSRFLLSHWLADMGRRETDEGERTGPGWVQIGPTEGRRKQVRITEAGIAVIRKVWFEYVEFAKEVLEGLPAESLEVHRRVNQQISDLAGDLR